LGDFSYGFSPSFDGVVRHTFSCVTPASRRFSSVSISSRILWEPLFLGYFQLLRSIRSVLDSPAALAEQIVAEVASGLQRITPQLRVMVSQSLAAFQKSLPEVGVLVADICQAGMIYESVVSANSRQPSS
jgi:hypothetical protein